MLYIVFLRKNFSNLSKNIFIRPFFYYQISLKKPQNSVFSSFWNWQFSLLKKVEFSTFYWYLLSSHSICPLILLMKFTHTPTLIPFNFGLAWPQLTNKIKCVEQGQCICENVFKYFSWHPVITSSYILVTFPTVAYSHPSLHPGCSEVIKAYAKFSITLNAKPLYHTCVFLQSN